LCLSCHSEVSSRGRQLGLSEATTSSTSPRRSPKFAVSSRIRCVTSRHSRRKPKHDVISAVALAVTYAKYVKAFRELLATGPAARRAFCCVVKRAVALEVQQFARTPQHFPPFIGHESLASFRWSRVLPELCRSMPTFYAAVSSSMPKRLLQSNGTLEYAKSLY